MTPRWYAIACAPRMESFVDFRIRSFGYRGLLPHFAEWLEGNKGKLNRLVKIAKYRGYTFVELDLIKSPMAFFHINEIKNKQGDRVARVVCVGRNRSGDKIPYPLSTDEMDEVLRHCDPHDGQVAYRLRDEEIKKRWAIGDQVQVYELGNPLAFYGVVKEELGGGRLIVQRLQRAMLGQDETEVREGDIQEVRRAS